MVDWYPLKRWLFTTNHKDVGLLYLFTSLYFFVAAGVLALTFRVQLAVPSNTFAGTYTSTWTLSLVSGP